jgi:histidinol-phosphate aminotransferase
MIEPRQNIKNLDRMRDFGSNREQIVRLDKNERIVPFTKKQFSKLMSLITPELLTMYPDQNPLYSKLAKFLGVNQQKILLTPGSDSAIKTIFETYVKPGDMVIFPNPTYAMVDVYAHMFEAKITKVGYLPDLEFKFSELIKAISEKTRLVYIANPNQPTSTILTKNEFEILLKKTAMTGTLLIVDEAYIDFACPDYSTIDYVDQYDNLMITRTFSKAFGLAAVRLGYIITHKSNVEYLFRVKTLSDINLFAIKYGEFLLDNYEIVHSYVTSVKQSKTIIKKRMEHLGLTCIDGHTNFIHIKIPETYDGGVIAQKLKEKGYAVRITGMGLPAVIEGCIRITVGPEKVMKRFLAVFEEILKDERKGF